MQKAQGKINAIIYCRVSTDEQAKHGYSLENQEQECIKFSLANNFVVGKVFIERGESAKTQERTQLKKLIKYAVENKKNISVFSFGYCAAYLKLVTDGCAIKCWNIKYFILNFNFD